MLVDAILQTQMQMQTQLRKLRMLIEEVEQKQAINYCMAARKAPPDAKPMGARSWCEGKEICSQRQQRQFP